MNDEVSNRRSFFFSKVDHWMGKNCSSEGTGFIMFSLSNEMSSRCDILAIPEIRVTW